MFKSTDIHNNTDFSLLKCFLFSHINKICKNFKLVHSSKTKQLIFWRVFLFHAAFFSFWILKRKTASFITLFIVWAAFKRQTERVQQLHMLIRWLMGKCPQVSSPRIAALLESKLNHCLHLLCLTQLSYKPCCAAWKSRTTNRIRSEQKLCVQGYFKQKRTNNNIFPPRRELAVFGVLMGTQYEQLLPLPSLCKQPSCLLLSNKCKSVK